MSQVTGSMGSTKIEEKGVKKFTLTNTLILFIMLVVLMIFFSLTSRSFLTYLNISTMLANLSFIGVTASALTLVLITGGLDISIGGTIGLVSCLVAWLYQGGMNAGYAMLIGLAAGMVVGALNGVLVTAVGLNPIITTLGTMGITRGLAFVITDGRSILIFEKTLGLLGRGGIKLFQSGDTLITFPIPVVLLIIVYAVYWFLMEKTKFGRQIYAIGANTRASYLSGVRTKRTTFIAYLLSGSMAAIGGLILTSLTAVGMPQHGMGQELNVIAAVILGGTMLGGGRGKILGTLLGVLIISVLYNGLVMLNVYFYFVSIAQGAVLIAVVAAYEARKRRVA